MTKNLQSKDNYMYFYSNISQEHNVQFFSWVEMNFPRNECLLDHHTLPSNTVLLEWYL